MPKSSPEFSVGTYKICTQREEKDDGKINVSAIDPKASMMAVGNKELNTVAKQVQEKLKKVIESL